MARLQNQTEIMNSSTPAIDYHTTNDERFHLRMHPRIFSALGADLVTNDVVAVIELVKNSYDAYARNVHLRFFENEKLGLCLEILDDGCGMTKEIIESVWCVVATPYKADNHYIQSIDGRRRVSGEKGLGRLSAARLGPRMRMLTRAAESPCYEVNVDWKQITNSVNLSDSTISCIICDGKEMNSQTGTLIQIIGLADWDNQKYEDLRENLARLISPFAEVNDFNIFTTGFNDDGKVEIQAEEFLSTPKYRIKGKSDKNGNIEAIYKYKSLADDSTRKQNLKLNWNRIVESNDGVRSNSSETKATCGPIEFEIRAWDIASEDTTEISEQFKIARSKIRNAIKAHKGISVYRDNLLVLPKSDNARDWLGLDLRRISRVGTRLSTNQIVGYVSISSDRNPGIQDTSDRERLVSRIEVVHFEEILKAVVGLLENERNNDRVRRDKRKMANLFENLSADWLLADVKKVAGKNETWRKTINLIQQHERRLSSSRETLQKRFVYYSRAAVVGTIAHMLVHEIRNRTIAFGAFLNEFEKSSNQFKNSKFKARYERAKRSIDTLEHLADKFSPLANIKRRKRNRTSFLENEIKESLDLMEKELKNKSIRCKIPSGETHVAVDPGELGTILLNLILNAMYWLDDMPEENREITFTTVAFTSSDRVRVLVKDSGPGIGEEDMEVVFLPGVTKKPNGIGMGLTVAAELVDANGGKLALLHPDESQGACFVFDLPLYKK